MHRWCIQPWLINNSVRVVCWRHAPLLMFLGFTEASHDAGCLVHVGGILALDWVVVALGWTAHGRQA